MNRFTEQIALAKVDGSLIKWMDRIKKAKLIIFDNFGLRPISHQVNLFCYNYLKTGMKKLLLLTVHNFL